MRQVFLGIVVALCAASPAHANWQEAASRHFVVYSDDAPDRLKAFTTKLERFDKALRVMRDVPDDPISPNSRVTVFVVKDVNAIQRLAGKGSGDVAGFYVPRAEGSVAFVPRRGDGDDEFALGALPILLHEYAHHFMFSIGGGSAYPAWFVEGFAEFNATAIFKDDGSVLLGAAPQYRADGILDDSVVSMQRLLTVDPNTLSDDARSTFYGRAWLLTHYLTLDSGRRGQLGQYLAALNKGESPDSAGKLLGEPGPLDRAINRYAGQPRLMAFTIKASAIPIGDVAIRALTPAEAAMMPARIASARGVDSNSAPGVAALARKLASSFPTDASAQNELAEAEYDAGDWAESQAAADRALVSDPTSVHAMLYRGMAMMAAASKAGNKDPAQWQAIRHWFSKANHADSDFAWPLELYYESYAAAGQTPTANAQAGLLYARDLAPFDPSLGMTAAYVYLKQGKADLARAALKPIAYNPHGGDAAAAAGRLIAAIDKDGAAGALALAESDHPAADATATAAK